MTAFPGDNLYPRFILQDAAYHTKWQGSSQDHFRFPGFFKLKYSEIKNANIMSDLLYIAKKFNIMFSGHHMQG